MPCNAPALGALKQKANPASGKPKNLHAPYAGMIQIR